MQTLQATTFRKDLYKILDTLASTRVPVQIVRFNEPIAVLVPASNLPTSKQKPILDLNLIAKFCKDHQVKSFALFGSILRDDFDDQSDVDVLVDLNGRQLKFHESCQMLDELELMFARKVDMVEKDVLANPYVNPRRKNAITTSAQVIYATS